MGLPGPLCFGAATTVCSVLREVRQIMGTTASQNFIPGNYTGAGDGRMGVLPVHQLSDGDFLVRTNVFTHDDFLECLAQGHGLGRICIAGCIPCSGDLELAFFYSPALGCRLCPSSSIYLPIDEWNRIGIPLLPVLMSNLANRDNGVCFIAWAEQPFPLRIDR